jgi:hypothetical protein
MTPCEHVSELLVHKNNLFNRIQNLHRVKLFLGMSYA